MYSYVIRMSLVCTRMSSVCHSYVIRMSLVCTRMSPVCHSSVVLPWTNLATFTATVASKGYSVYKNTSWTIAKVEQKVMMELETKRWLLETDPYACAIRMKNKFFEDFIFHVKYHGMCSLFYQDQRVKISRQVKSLMFANNFWRLRSILDAVLKQGVLRLFQHGLVRLGTPLF